MNIMVYYYLGYYYRTPFNLENDSINLTKDILETYLDLLRIKNQKRYNFKI